MYNSPSTSGSESSVKLGHFEDRCNIEWEYEGPPRTCKCGHFAPRWTCWTEANAGRRFFGCPMYKEKNSCDFFIWYDTVFDKRAKEVIRQLTSEKYHLLHERDRLWTEVKLGKTNNCIPESEIIALELKSIVLCLQDKIHGLEKKLVDVEKNLEDKFDSSVNKMAFMGGKIESLEKDMQNKFGSIEQKMVSMVQFFEDKFGGMEQKMLDMDKHLEEIDSLDKKKVDNKKAFGKLCVVIVVSCGLPILFAMMMKFVMKNQVLNLPAID